MDYITLLRQPKIFSMAIFDLSVSYLGIFLISPILTKLFSLFHLNISRSSWLWLTLPISIIFHLIFNQKTALIKILSDPKQFQFYIAVATLLFMSYMGLKSIKIK